MATATRPSRFRIERPSVQDRKRWYLWKSDKTPAEIAAREHVSIKEVQKSIDKVESYRFLGSVEEVDAEYNIAALELIEEQKQVVQKAMRAKKTRTNVVTGKEVTVEDFVTQLAAAKEAREMAFASRMKGPAIVYSLLQQNNGGQKGSGGGMDFESRLRILREKNHGRLPGAVVVQGELMAPKEQSHAEKLIADMEDAGIELSEKELDELNEIEEGDDEGTEEPDGEDNVEDDEDSEAEEVEGDDSDDDQGFATQGQVSPAQDSNPEDGW